MKKRQTMLNFTPIYRQYGKKIIKELTDYESSYQITEDGTNIHFDAIELKIIRKDNLEFMPFKFENLNEILP